MIIGFDEDKVHEYFPEASMVAAMLYWSIPSHKKAQTPELIDNGKYLASIKIDGFFYELNKTQNHTYLFSRNKSTTNGLLTEKIDRVPHIKEAAAALPPDTLLVGEIYIPGKKSKDVTSIMGCLPAKAIERQENSEWKIHYYLHDVIMYDGLDWTQQPFEERADLVLNIYNQYFSEYDFITVAQNKDSNIWDYFNKVIEQGEEGLVLRKKDSLYKPGKRTAWDSIKLKTEKTFDVIITGFEDPTVEYTGKEIDTWPYWKMIEGVETAVTKPYYYGWKNRIRVSAYDKEGQLKEIGTISSGLTDELREAFAETPENFLGRVVEIKAMSVDKTALTIRHGFFVRFRDDKNAEECTIKEIFK